MSTSDENLFDLAMGTVRAEERENERIQRGQAITAVAAVARAAAEKEDSPWREVYHCLLYTSPSPRD